METIRADFLDVALDFVVQELFDYSDPFETLASSVDEMWRRGWAPGTKHRVVHDLGDGPADVFTEVTGVDLDDFLALAWVFGTRRRTKARSHSRPCSYGLFGSSSIRARCARRSSLIVHRSLKDELLQHLLDATAIITVGDPLDPDTSVGALVEEKHRHKVLNRIGAARADGAALLVGGS